AMTVPPARVEAVLDGLLEVVTRVSREFNGVVRFNVGDAYCLTFGDAVASMTAARNLLALWEAFLDKAGASCPMHVATHKCTLSAFRSYLYGHDLNVAFGVEFTSQGFPSTRGGLVVTGVVRRDLEGTPWAARLVPQPVTPTRDDLKDIEVFTLRMKDTQ